MVTIPQANTPSPVSLGNVAQSTVRPVGAQRYDDALGNALGSLGKIGDVVLGAVDFMQKENDKTSLWEAEGIYRRKMAEKFDAWKRENQGKNASQTIPELQKIHEKIRDSFFGAKNDLGIDYVLPERLRNQFYEFADGQYTATFSQGINYAASETSKAQKIAYTNAIDDAVKDIADSGMDFNKVQQNINSIAGQNYQYLGPYDAKAAYDSTIQSVQNGMLNMLQNNLASNVAGTVSAFNNENKIYTIGKKKYSIRDLMTVEQQQEFLKAARKVAEDKYTEDLAQNINDQTISKAKTDLANLNIFSKDDLLEAQTNMIKKANEIVSARTQIQTEENTRENNAMLATAVSGNVAQIQQAGVYNPTEMGNAATVYTNAINKMKSDALAESLKRENKKGIEFKYDTRFNVLNSEPYADYKFLNDNYGVYALSTDMWADESMDYRNYVNTLEFQKAKGKDQVEFLHNLTKKFQFEQDCKAYGRDFRKDILDARKKVIGANNYSKDHEFVTDREFLARAYELAVGESNGVEMGGNRVVKNLTEESYKNFIVRISNMAEQNLFQRYPKGVREKIKELENEYEKLYSKNKKKMTREEIIRLAIEEVNIPLAQRQIVYNKFVEGRMDRAAGALLR